MEKNHKKIVSGFIYLILFLIGMYFYQLTSIYPALVNKIDEGITESFDNVEINYEILNKKNVKTIFVKGDENKPLVIYFHGNYEIIDHYVNFFQGISHVSGVNVLMVEYNGYGNSEGRPSLEASSKSTFEWLNNNLAHKKLKTLKRQEVIVWGRSIGSAHALDFADRYTEYVDHIILQSGFMSLANAMTTNDILASIINPLIIGDYVAAPKIKNIVEKGYLKTATIVHGKNDKLFDVKYGRQLSEEFEKNNFEEIEYIEYDGDHNSFNFGFNGMIYNLAENY